MSTTSPVTLFVTAFCPGMWWASWANTGAARESTASVARMRVKRYMDSSDDSGSARARGTGNVRRNAHSDPSTPYDRTLGDGGSTQSRRIEARGGGDSEGMGMSAGANSVLGSTRGATIG